MTLSYSLDEDTIKEADEAETIQILARGEIHRMNTNSVGKVVAFDPIEGIAEVELAVQQYEVMAEGKVFFPSKTILALMVGFPGGPGQAVVCQPGIGDLVVVEFSRESLREFREHGDHNIKPASAAVFGWEGAIITGRVQPFSKPLAWEEGAIVIGDDPYKGGPVAVDDPLMRVRVKRGAHAELCREQTGEEKVAMRVSANGACYIGSDEVLDSVVGPTPESRTPAELIALLERLIGALPGMVTSGPFLAPPGDDPTLFADAAAIMARLKSGV